MCLMRFPLEELLHTTCTSIMQVDCGTYGYIDLKMQNNMLMDIEPNKSAYDPMNF